MIKSHWAKNNVEKTSEKKQHLWHFVIWYSDIKVWHTFCHHLLTLKLSQICLSFFCWTQKKIF